jgi:hypothetical protein
LIKSRWAQRDYQTSICALICFVAALKVSKNAAIMGLFSDFRQATHKGIRADFGEMGRIAT